MPKSRFLKCFLLSLIFFSAGISLVNWIIDPYSIFGSPRFNGINELKPAVKGHSRVFKLHNLHSGAYKTVTLGTSRVDRGYAPSSTAWPAGMKPVYNLGLGGETIAESYVLLESALRTGHLQSVLLGIEFIDFLPASNVSSSPRFAARTATLGKRAGNLSARHENLGAQLDIYQEEFSYLLSFDALWDSFYTLLLQTNPDVSTIDQFGFNPLREGTKNITHQGHYPLFISKYNPISRDILCRLVDPETLTRNDYAESEAGQILMRVLHVVAENNLNLVIVIQPQHSDMEEIWRSAGLLQSYRNWKTYLVESVSRIQKESGADISAWDFSGYSTYNAEDVPESGDRRSIMKWHVEPGHFTSALGDKVLERIFSGVDAGSEPYQFGKLLYPASDQSQDYKNKTDTEERNSYLAKNVDRLTLLKSIVEKNLEIRFSENSNTVQLCD